MKFLLLLFIVLPIRANACSGKIQCSLSCYENLHSSLKGSFVMPGRISGYTFSSSRTPYVVIPSKRNGKDGFYSFEFGKSDGSFVAYDPEVAKKLASGERMELVVDRNKYRGVKTAKIDLGTKGDFSYYTYENISSELKVTPNQIKLKADRNKTTSEHSVRDEQAELALNELLIKTIATLKPTSGESAPPWYGRNRNRIIKGINLCLEVISDSDIKKSLSDLASEVCTGTGSPETGCVTKKSGANGQAVSKGTNY
jgi:hypothetical protein